MNKLLAINELYDIRDKHLASNQYIMDKLNADKIMTYYSFEEFCKLYNYFFKNNNDVEVFYDSRLDFILQLNHTRYDNTDNFLFEEVYSFGASHATVFFDYKITYQYKLSLNKSKPEEIIKLMDRQLRTKHMFKSGHMLSREYKKLAFSFNIKQGTKVIVIDEQIPLQYRINEDKYSKDWIRIR